jgi:hypothetical protein
MIQQLELFSRLERLQSRCVEFGRDYIICKLKINLTFNGNLPFTDDISEIFTIVVFFSEFILDYVVRKPCIIYLPPTAFVHTSTFDHLALATILYFLVVSTFLRELGNIPRLLVEIIDSK